MRKISIQLVKYLKYNSAIRCNVNVLALLTLTFSIQSLCAVTFSIYLFISKWHDSIFKGLILCQGIIVRIVKALIELLMLGRSFYVIKESSNIIW